MAKQPAKNANISINAVALEDEIDDFALTIDQEVPESNGLSEAGPRRVVSNYDFGLEIGGKPDFDASQADATLHALVGSTGVAMALDPTGASAGSNDPNYDATSVVLERYSIRGRIGGAIEFAASLKGNSALSRAVS